MLPHHVFRLWFHAWNLLYITSSQKQVTDVSLWFHAWNLLYITSSQKQVTDVSLILKDSDTESENLSSMIRPFVSDSQKTDSSKDESFISI